MAPATRGALSRHAAAQPAPAGMAHAQGMGMEALMTSEQIERAYLGQEGAEGHTALLRGFAWFVYDPTGRVEPKPPDAERLCPWSVGAQPGYLWLTTQPEILVPNGEATPFAPIGESCLYADSDLTVFAARKLSGWRWLYVLVTP